MEQMEQKGRVAIPSPRLCETAVANNRSNPSPPFSSGIKMLLMPKVIIPL